MKRTDFQHFYVNPANLRVGRLILDGDEYHHAVKVLRKQEGDPLTAVDGRGGLYSGVIERVEKTALTVKIASKEFGIAEARLQLTVALSALKGDHFDMAVEKGTEIGVAAFQPMTCERTIADASSRIERWRHKALTAMKQCGRTVCPEILRPQPFNDLVVQPFEIALIAHEDTETPIDVYEERLRSATAAVVWVGPEGGFTDREYRAAVERGVLPISLGPRRLRSETSALTAAIKILSLAGEL